MKNDEMPDWFHQELVNLLYSQYKGTDFNKFLQQLKSDLQNKRVSENKKSH